jgi:hypothetical protein
VVYGAVNGNKTTLWKIPATGGTPTPLTDFYAFNPVVSPDGQWLAFFFFDEAVQAVRLGVVSFAATAGAAFSRTAVQAFSPLPRLRAPLLRWAADSRSLVYSQHQGGVSNLWRQPLAGGAPVPVTAFTTTGSLFSFDLARASQQFVLERGQLVSDLVLIRNSR